MTGYSGGVPVHWTRLRLLLEKRISGTAQESHGLKGASAAYLARCRN